MNQTFVDGEAAFRTLLEGDEFGGHVSLDEICPVLACAPALSSVEFSLSNLARDAAFGGVGTALFSKSSAANDNGWSENSLVCHVAVGTCTLVIVAGSGTPEYCDDEGDGWMNGTATLFSDQRTAIEFAETVASDTALAFCHEAIHKLIKLSHGVFPDDLARKYIAESDTPSDWLVGFAKAVTALASAPQSQ